jgi:hypothetical protein
MTRQSLTRIAAGAAVAGLVALAAGPAGALPRLSSTSSTSSTLPGGGAGQPGAKAGANQATQLQFIQKAGDAAITARLASLNKVVTDLATVPAGCDASPLTAKAQSDITALTGLETQLNQETTVQAAKADVQQIFLGYRVYALVIPVDEMVVATCRMSDVITKVQALVQKLSGVNDPNIAALVADMGTQATNAGTAINGLAATLEGYTPDMWNSNHQLLVTARQSLRTARKDLAQCSADAHKILAIVRHDLSAGGTGGSAVNPNASTTTTPSTSSPSTSSTTSPSTSTTVGA